MTDYKFDKVKNAGQLAGLFPGVTIEVVHVDKLIDRVVLTGSDGRSLTFARSNAYDSLLATVSAAPVMVTAHRLHGKWRGLVVDEVFSDVYVAQDRLRDLTGNDEEPGLVIEETRVTEGTV